MIKSIISLVLCLAAFGYGLGAVSSVSSFDSLQSDRIAAIDAATK